MTYFIRYDTVEGEEINEYSAACFSNIYSSTKSFDSIKIYIVKDYKAIKKWKPTQLNNNLTHEEHERYLNILHEIGFNVKMYESETWHNQYHKEVLLDSYVYEIDCKNNTEYSILLLLNFIRYIHEQNMHLIVKLLFELCDVDKKVHPLNKIFLAASAVWVNNDNHNIIENSNIILLHNEEEIQDILTNTKKVNNIKNIIKKTGLPDIIRKYYDTEETKKLLKEWIKLKPTL